MANPKKKIFNRWNNHLGNTIALKIFNSHQKHSSELIKALSNSGVFSYGFISNQGCNWESPLPHLKGIMGIKGTNIKRKPIIPNWPDDKKDACNKRKVLSVKQWSDFYKDAMNWVRLNSIVSSVGNFEMYLIKVTTLALKSDLGLLIGTSKTVDGAIALKYPSTMIQSLEPLITSLTKGEWTSRLSSFKKLFGDCPPFMKNNLSKLEKLRKLRNSIAHAFARNIDLACDPNIIQIEPMARISNAHLEKQLTFLSKCATAIDKQLLCNHIGEYELINLYHQMYPDFQTTLSIGEKGRRFKKDCGSKFHMISVKFAKQLAEYYEII
jgi:hypothetical protein